MKKRTFLILFILTTILTSCQDKYDRIERFSEAAKLESKLKKDAYCDDAIITIDKEEGEDSTTLKIILINSKDVTLDKSDEFKATYCWKLSCVLVENYLQQPFQHKWIQILLVEKTNFIIQTEKYYGQTYLLRKVSEAVAKKNAEI